MFAQVTAVAAGEGLAYDFDRAIAANTFAAHRLVHLARTTGGPSWRSACSRRCSRRTSSTAPTWATTRRSCGSSAAPGSTPRPRGPRWRATPDADAVRADEDEARALGVTGVPFFVVDRRIAVSGAQPADVFTQLLETAWRDANPVQVLATARRGGLRRRLLRHLTLRTTGRYGGAAH